MGLLWKILDGEMKENSIDFSSVKNIILKLILENLSEYFKLKLIQFA